MHPPRRTGWRTCELLFILLITTLNPRQMLRINVYPIFASISTAALVAIAAALFPIAKQAIYHNQCVVAVQERRVAKQKFDDAWERIDLYIYRNKICNGGTGRIGID